ncbi:hypothetical protein [Levilactobacillus tongjiangensis]|uniref:Uncharacterized protein n=1 Tax=Levilactobacillus tongjiangensis TaxID=2486023 RepID=A0ABW1SQE8_9LACO|nr:hypothetical protein [Levilactobacillus tongjiangensis]
MANTKNSQAAKIRQQIIAWLQDDTQTEVVSEEKFPGIRGIRAVTLRQMLGEQGYVSSVVMGAVSAAPSIDQRIKKAALKPREVYYYFDASTPAPKRVQAATSAAMAASTSQVSAKTASAPVVHTTAVSGLPATTAFGEVLATNQQLRQQVDDLLTAAQRQRGLSDIDLKFLSDFAAQVTQQSELLQTFATQSRIEALRRG